MARPMVALIKEMAALWETIPYSAAARCLQGRDRNFMRKLKEYKEQIMQPSEMFYSIFGLLVKTEVENSTHWRAFIYLQVLQLSRQSSSAWLLSCPEAAEYQFCIKCLPINDLPIFNSG